MTPIRAPWDCGIPFKLAPVSCLMVLPRIPEKWRSRLLIYFTLNSFGRKDIDWQSDGTLLRMNEIERRSRLVNDDCGQTPTQGRLLRQGTSLTVWGSSSTITSSGNI